LWEERNRPTKVGEGKRTTTKWSGGREKWQKSREGTLINNYDKLYLH